MEENAEKKEFDKRLLALPLIPLLLAPLLAAFAGMKYLKGRKERAAVKALARQLVAERKSGKKGGGKARGKQGKKATARPRAVVAVRENAKSRMGAVSRARNLLSKNVFKFLMMALAERLIASQRAKLKDSLPPLPLSGRLSKAKDI